MNLPKPNEKIAPTLLNPRTLLFYGTPKLGKTSLLATLPDSLLIDVEDGSDACETGAKVKISSLEELGELGREIIKQKKPYKYIIVDSLTALEALCEADATIKYKNSVIGKSFKGDSVIELPRGAGYYWWRLSYGTYFNDLCKLADCFIGIAHVRDKFLVDKKGNEVESSDLDLTGKLKAITCSKADAICYLHRKTVGAENGKPLEEIWASFRSSDVTAGSRFRRLSGKDFSLSKIVEDENIPITAEWNKIFI